MGAALLMVESPPVVTEDGVELVKVMVKVGPPLFARVPRFSVALLTVVAQVLVDLFVSRLTMLLVEAGFTTLEPLAEKSFIGLDAPSVLLAMMVLKILSTALL